MTAKNNLLFGDTSTRETTETLELPKDFRTVWKTRTVPTTN